MADQWPISIREAARRLKIERNTACILVRTHEIPTIQIGMSKGLDKAAYRRLSRYAVPFQQSETGKALSA